MSDRNKILYPSIVKTGDKAIIISPSGCVDETFITGAKNLLLGWGLDIEIAPFAKEEFGRYGGTVDQRLSDLQNSFDNKSIKMILCSRGGYGIVHLLSKLNFDNIRKNPKWLVGFSDITALHLALLQNGIASVHAPMARHLTEYPFDASTALLKKVLFEKDLTYNLYSHSFNRSGNVKGRLVGGNLAVLTGLIGTSYMKLPNKPILFIEDVGEAPYKIDRMMWQLKLSGILEKLSGLIIGQFSEYKEDPLMGATVYESILAMVKEYKYPVVFDFPVGHVEDNYALIHGAKVILDVKRENVILKFDR